ncbi:MAG TPA: TIGR03084 family metal-binding protein [Streptosporangiaceae bacterium]|nr:TIGR03084 family metal-binding protein [Streptosporangiaceae bacterium]
MAIIDGLLADLAAEGDDLDRVVSGIGPDQWQLATPAPGWTIAHQIGHLASSDWLATLAATDAEAFAARQAELAGDFDAAVEAGAAVFAADPPGQLLSRWRETRSGLRDALAAVPPGQRVPWIVEPIAPATLATTRLMELFGHGQDVRDALGAERPLTDAIVHVARLGIRTRDFAYLARGLTPPAGEFRIELSSPTGQVWTFGPEDAAQGVNGPLLDFCLLVTQRRHRDDLRLVARGPDADRWLSFAQAYAGPPGRGRAPGQFAPAQPD